jgi:hypothetical protein
MPLKNVTVIHHQKTIEIQNKKLRDIAWTQSHVVRAPIKNTGNYKFTGRWQENSPEEIYFGCNN